MKKQFCCQVLVVSAALLAQGCSKSSSTATPPVDQPVSAVAESNYKNRSLEFPADFPLPRYPNSVIEGSREKGGKANNYTVLLVSTDNVKTVFGFYAKCYKQDGWDIGKVIKSKSYMMINARKSGIESNVVISETRSGRTAISLFASKK